MVYCYISGCSVKLQALTNAIFCPGCTGINSGLEVGEGRVERGSKHAHMGRGYISLWEKIFPSTNPSSSIFGLRWEIAVCWCLVAMDLLDFGHLEHSDLSSWTAPAFGVSFLLPCQPSQKATGKGLSLGLAYQRDVPTAGPSLNETSSQFCAA